MNLPANLMGILAWAAFTLLGVYPQGAVLTLGNHEWHEMIAARCSAGGHHHEPIVAHTSTPCDDHNHSHHHERHEPCAEIQLGLSDCRIETSDQLPAELFLAIGWWCPPVELSHAADLTQPVWRPAWRAVSLRSPPLLERLLRSTILQI